jgi:aryl-alcohol dehydrogenase (NADP+)
MRYRLLGKTGIYVSELCLGTMTFGVETDEPGAHEQLDRFVAAGGTLVDTADTYGNGRSEEIIGRWLASRPAGVTEPVVLATKGRFPLDDSPNGAGLSTRHLTRALDAQSAGGIAASAPAAARRGRGCGTGSGRSSG